MSSRQRVSSRALSVAAAAVCLSASVSGFSASSQPTTTITNTIIFQTQRDTTTPNNNRIRQPKSHLYNDNSNDSAEGEASSISDSSASQPVSLFEDISSDNTDSLSAAKFGESVPLKRPEASFGESVPLKRPEAAFGESVPLKRPSSSNNKNKNNSRGEPPLMTDNTNFMEAAASTVNAPPPETGAELAAMRKRNLIAAVASISLALLSYLWQFTHPVTPVQLLADMQATSAPLSLIGKNGKPTVVDFWAPWCENCKMAAPTLQKVEQDYKDRVNFVLINGDQAAAWPLIERFGVDAIPHMALISAEGDVETALIGPIPKRVLEADLNVLLENAALGKSTTTTTAAAAENGPSAVVAAEGVADTATAAPDQKQELPYKMLDVFVNQPQYRRIEFAAKEE